MSPVISKLTVEPEEIVKYCVNTAKLTVNNRFYLSILTMKKFLSYQDGYIVNTDPSRESETCNGGPDCYLHKFWALRNVIVMTLLVEKYDNYKFEVRPFDNHTIQNCEVTATYLSNLYNNSRIPKEVKFHNEVIRRSNDLYNKYSEDYNAEGYGPRSEDDQLPGIKQILPRGAPNKAIKSKPIVNGLAFSDIVKIGIPDSPSGTPQVSEEDDEIFPELENLIEQINLLGKEKDEYQKLYEEELKKRKAAEQLIAEQNEVLKKRSAELLEATSKINKLKVMFGSIKSNMGSNSKK